jgi:GDPmannose 4,6-dehydratase
MLRPLDVNHLIGDSSKAARTLGWKHSVGFDELAKIMTMADMDRWNRHTSGESFAWDVPNAIPDSLGLR